MRGRLEVVNTVKLLMTCANPRMVPVVLLRLAEFFDAHHLGVLAKICAVLNVMVFGIEISPKVDIGGGLFLPHTVGTVIGAARIGINCTIMQGVTLGASTPDLNFTAAVRPVVGDNVTIGSGAKIFGGIVVGNNCNIGANAVVLCDVPEYALAVGVPAKILVRPVPGVQNAE